MCVCVLVFVLQDETPDSAGQAFVKAPPGRYFVCLDLSGVPDDTLLAICAAVAYRPHAQEPSGAARTAAVDNTSTPAAGEPDVPTTLLRSVSSVQPTRKLVCRPLRVLDPSTNHPTAIKRPVSTSRCQPPPPLVRMACAKPAARLVCSR